MSNPTRAQKLYWNRLANDVGCICCRIDGVHNTHVSIHHVDGRTKQGCHDNVLPLCFFHHQGGNEENPSVHPWKARFESRYGSQPELVKYCKRLLDGENAQT